MVIEKKNIVSDNSAKVNLKNRILNFKASTSSSFGDASEWQQNQRSDSELPIL
ncbi:hypothetical protein ACQKL8_03310 [Pedobacter suwonensis]|uniref:hypothetical protein n=1 Tax=Pedobacter suwonensis TaxID=332999 RepID=UPI00381DE97B